MTNTLKSKIIMAIWAFQDNHPYEHVNGVTFHHYGNDYRIEELPDPDRIVIYRHNPHGIHDDIIAAATVNDNGGITVKEA